jgi:hypothetical protein
VTIGEEYPVLEYLILVPSMGYESSALMLPETLQAPHLHHLSLMGFALPIGSRLLTTAVGLITLVLIVGNPHNFFQPNTLLRWLSFMPHLETLMIAILSPVPNRDVERQPVHIPITTHITLPNLRRFEFRGVSAYIDRSSRSSDHRPSPREA